MDVKTDIPQEPKFAAPLWTAMRIALWTILALGSLIRSTLFSKKEPYNPYWAEEGQSENIPTLKY